MAKDAGPREAVAIRLGALAICAPAIECLAQVLSEERIAQLDSSDATDPGAGEGGNAACEPPQTEEAAEKERVHA